MYGVSGVTDVMAPCSAWAISTRAMRPFVVTRKAMLPLPESTPSVASSPSGNSRLVRSPVAVSATNAGPARDCCITRYRTRRPSLLKPIGCANSRGFSMRTVSLAARRFPRNQSRRRRCTRATRPSSLMPQMERKGPAMVSGDSFPVWRQPDHATHRSNAAQTRRQCRRRQAATWSETAAVARSYARLFPD